jgi:chemotaxis protein methyltransferase CheR
MSAPELFDLVFCRNVVFTYFSDDLQVRIATMIESHLSESGFLVTGKHEKLPAVFTGLRRVAANMPIYT